MDVPEYPLPAGAIAQAPAEPRDAARLLVALGGTVAHRRVHDLPDLVGPGDVVVVNTSRVLAARLRLTKATGGAAEVLLLEPDAGPDPDETSTWTALVRPGRRLAPGTVLLGGTRPLVEVGERLDAGRRRVRLLVPAALLDEVGTVPLPPYIRRALPDPERYQTVYADRPGSVAAPTAGLHLTEDVLDRCRQAGATVEALDLAVGLGTFRPVSEDRVEDHNMHGERYSVPAATMAACRGARRVIAVGTTTVRALESAAASGRLEGRTELFIHGDFPFSVVDVLLTNFHQPRSTLLLLLESFCGPRWRALYEVALESGYRFLSFGDAMLVERAGGGAEAAGASGLAPPRRETR
ncbi:MAG TPA: tRNA preQ1(34) S-adenosylmethionine ribosyltransferase-isomerase QueA [Acidimicrobiales bacterium]|nr:tRNA preQ1(34) S-adenosylmethionine ribosyltransferase-isomerase QueA [Acidimicrobiales bacterium]